MVKILLGVFLGIMYIGEYLVFVLLCIFFRFIVKCEKISVLKNLDLIGNVFYKL